MSLLTQKMQTEMHSIQCAAAMRCMYVRAYVSKSFAAVPMLIESGHLASRKEVQNFIDMVSATTSAYINTR